MFNLPSPPLPVLPPRPKESHKGDFGHALFIGGCRGMSGAIAMAGLAAIRSGAGLTTLAVPDRCLETVAQFSPCAMAVPLPDDAHGRIALAAMDVLESWLIKATCIAIGPGLGRSRDLQSLICKILRHATCPVVLDADGLNNLAESGWWPRKFTCPLVLTPHPGEWFRLSGINADQSAAQCQSVVETAKRLGITIVLKGHQTLITDGETAVINTTGTPAMAVGGSGDVLTGVISALICQGLKPRDAAHLGTHVHGAAGQAAQEKSGSHVVLPTELIEFLFRT